MQPAKKAASPWTGSTCQCRPSLHSYRWLINFTFGGALHSDDRPVVLHQLAVDVGRDRQQIVQIKIGALGQFQRFCQRQDGATAVDDAVSERNQILSGLRLTLRCDTLVFLPIPRTDDGITICSAPALAIRN